MTPESTVSRTAAASSEAAAAGRAVRPRGRCWTRAKRRPARALGGRTRYTTRQARRGRRGSSRWRSEASLRDEDALHDLSLASEARDQLPVVDDLRIRGVAALDAHLFAGEGRGLSGVVDAAGALNVGPVNRREDPGVAAIHEHVHHGCGVRDDDVARLLDRSARAVASDDPERLRTCWK